MARNAFQKRRERQLLLLLLPAILPLLLLVIYPALYAVYLSMTNEALTGAAALHPRFVGLNNYFRLFGDGRFWNSLLVTAIFVVGSAIIGQFVLGFAAALLLHRRIKGAAAFGIAILLPNAAPEVVAGFMWISMLAGGDHATLSKIMIALGLPWSDWLQTMPLFMTTMVNTWRGIGTAMILLTAGLSAIPNDVYEAARMDGATPRQSFLRITLPLMAPTIFLYMLISTVSTIAVFALVNSCSIPDDHIYPHQSAFFMAGSVLKDIRNGCSRADIFTARLRRRRRCVRRSGAAQKPLRYWRRGSARPSRPSTNGGTAQLYMTAAIPRTGCKSR